MNLETLFFLLLGALLFFRVVRFAGFNQRLVVYRMGKPVRIGGLGPVIIVPLLEQCKTIDIRPRSLPLPEVAIPGLKTSVVSGTYTAETYDPLKFTAAEDAADSTRKAVHAVLLSVIPQATMLQCLKEKSTLEQLLLQRVNEKTKFWGVRITAVNLNDFPYHRRLIKEIAYIFVNLTRVAGAIVSMDGAFSLCDQTSERERRALENQPKDIAGTHPGYKFGINN